MSINLALILGHSMDAANLLTFPQRVRSSIPMRGAAERLWQVMAPRWDNLGPVDEFSTMLPSEPWSGGEVVTAWKRRQAVKLEWAGFSLYFGERSVEAVHLEKLAGFVLDLDSLRGPLRDCAVALASELGSPRIVYGPDCFSPFEHALEPGSGGSLEDLLAVAYQMCGGPARGIREMANEDEELNLESSCYYVEVVDAFANGLKRSG